MRTLFLAIAICSMLLACRKNRTYNNELVGSWKLVQTSRISQPWTAVGLAEEFTYTFDNKGRYSEKRHPVSSYYGCPGKYRLAGGNTLFMTQDCAADPNYETENGYLINGDTLIIDYRTTSTGVKGKFVRW